MIKILLLVGTLLINAFAADANSETLKSMGESGGLAAGAGGLAIVHGTFWVPLTAFFIVAGAIVFYYYKQFKAKDDGLFKTVGAFGLAIILGVIVYVSCLKLVDTMFDEEGCGSSIVTAYMKDSVRKGLNPSEVFGESIRNLSCIK